ncbi:PadR family transcriptional regulator [Streptococcus vestibularis]|uniref:Lineage-specific thermal regulator protein n=1 Tax=Streptococcus vestibularis TaxID=1343 RepID=A0A564T0V2_STRVE|nr:PadR family transcriptional regulator [Streptococcus vestibularis]VUX01088.1 lineage-specific thermal regulator protein [Streptococcus vestibularis]
MKGRDVILGILSKQERTGYEIKEIFQSQLSYFYDGTYGMIYPTLKKLEQDGLVSKRVIMQTGKPNKNIYSITASGEKELQKYLESNVIEESFKSDFLMRLFFGVNLTDEELIRLLKDEIKNKEKKIVQLTNNLKTWKDEGITKTQELTIRYGLAQYGATKAVLEEELKKINPL